jgi:hypothetical protein
MQCPLSSLAFASADVWHPLPLIFPSPRVTPFGSESRTHPPSCRLHDDHECSFHCTAGKLLASDPNGCMNSRYIGDRMLCANCDLSCANNNISSQIDREAGRAAYCFPWNITRSCTEVLRPGANVLVLVRYLQRNQGAQRQMPMS